MTDEENKITTIQYGNGQIEYIKRLEVPRKPKGSHRIHYNERVCPTCGARAFNIYFSKEVKPELTHCNWCGRKFQEWDE